MANVLQSIRSHADTVAKHSGTTPSLSITNVLIRRRNLTSAMCVQWPLLAETDCVSLILFPMFGPTDRCMQRLILVFTPARNLWSVENALIPARTRPT